MSGPQWVPSRFPGSPGSPLKSGASGRRGASRWASGGCCGAAPPPPLADWASPLTPLPLTGAQVLAAISESMETTEQAGNLEGGGG